MSSLKTLQHLREIEKKKLKLQEAAVGRSAIKRKTEEDNLEQLKTWEQQYRENLTRIENGPMTGALLRDYAHFLRQLENVITQQEAVVKQAYEQEKNEKRRWKTLYDTGLKVEKVTQKKEEVEERENDMRDQKKQDELIMSRSSRPKYRS